MPDTPHREALLSFAVRVLRALALMLLLAACATARGVPVPMPADGVTVKMDGLSGLPNQTWILTPAEAAELEVRMRGLPVAVGALMPETGLAYRGFKLVVPATADGAEQRIRVFSGLVQVGGDEGTVYRDMHALEEWLGAQFRRYGQAGAVPRARP